MEGTRVVVLFALLRAGLEIIGLMICSFATMNAIDNSREAESGWRVRVKNNGFVFLFGAFVVWVAWII
jgi:hypothetical protein